MVIFDAPPNGCLDVLPNVFLDVHPNVHLDALHRAPPYTCLNPSFDIRLTALLYGHPDG